MNETAFAADPDGDMILFLWIGLYFYFSFMQFRIAERVGHRSPWHAWIPIVSIFQQVKMARKDSFWFVLCLVPIINIFAFIFIWMDIARECGKSPVWGLMATVPLLNIIAWGYLAFSGEEVKKPRQAMVITSYRENEPVG